MHVILRPRSNSGNSSNSSDTSASSDSSNSNDAVELVEVSATGQEQNLQVVQRSDLAAVVRERAAQRPRWVWADTHMIYPDLLAAGVRVERCVDLRLTHAILRNNPHAPGFGTTASGWDDPRPTAHATAQEDDVVGLFDLAPPVAATPDPVAEFRAQQDALARTRSASPDAAGRLGLLLAAESAGALVAAEMTFAGLPWDTAVHNAMLTELLGARPAPGHRPELLSEKLEQVRTALDAPQLNADSAPDLLRALQNAGVQVRTTRSAELETFTHPAILPLLEYKKMSRFMAANGWHWLDTWVRGGRFHPVYVPGGVVTGRWAADGGGAMQLPHQVRSAVRADPGWKLVVADAAQLEPRILAAMSGDRAMDQAGRGEDMYAGMVAAGAVGTRDQAKFGMLGAMYGGTTGESGRMLPRLRAAFPQAIALVEDAAQTGERGGRVQTWLGRTSPAPDDAWQQRQDAVREASGDGDGALRARGAARSWGRFTRNFIVQGTAAEWALAWMATIRQGLQALELPASTQLRQRPHQVFFLHDEVMIHTPAHCVDAVVDVLQRSATEAGRLLFGSVGGVEAAGARVADAQAGGAEAGGVEFPISVAVVDSYDEAD